MNRRIQRLGLLLVVAVFLLLARQTWLYFHLYRVLVTPSHGNIYWQLDGAVLETSKETFPADSVYSRSNRSSTNLSRFIEQANSEQFVTNQQLYGSLPSPTEPNLTSKPDAVFLIQIHNRLENLRALIESIGRVRGIQSALLIFSSDFISNDAGTLIRSIPFARTTQIYFPHSIQVFSDVFPGKSPRDCDWNVSPQQARSYGCINAEWFDKFSHYRNPHFTQVKHHWLWKLVFVFERLHAVKHYTGYIILLEEDHYVVEDLLHVSKLVENIWNPTEAQGLVAFGSYSERQNYENPQVTVNPWLSSRDNMGIGISRAMWNRLKKCLTMFCSYDDYNWDWTLQYIGSSCLSPKLNAMQFTEQTRVYHLGACGGLHHTTTNCSVQLLAQRITQTLQGSVSSHLFPAKLSLSDSRMRSFSTRPNGGWGDLRDVALCNSVAAGTWQPQILKHAPHLTQFAAL